MCRTNCEIRKTCCKIRETCCPCCIDMEKTDTNLDYGDYYYEDGERRQDVMEVTFWFPSSISINQCLFICMFQDIQKIQNESNIFRCRTITLPMSRAGTPTRLRTTTTCETTIWDSKGLRSVFKVSPILVRTHLHIRKPVDMALLALIRPNI